MPGSSILNILLKLAQTQVHSTISSSAILFFFCLQYSPASGSFQMSQAFCIRWPKYWSFSFSISPSNEYSGLISFRIDWFDLLAAQWTQSSPAQFKASTLCCAAFFMVQLSHPYMTTGKMIALTILFVSKVRSLLFKMLSRFVIAFLPRSKHLLISWLQSPPTVILETKKIKSVSTDFTFSPFFFLHEVMGTYAMILIFLIYLFGCVGS